jgi:hypothetical protein
MLARILLLLSPMMLSPVVVARPAFFWQPSPISYLAADYLDFAGSDLDNRDGDEIGGLRSCIAGSYQSKDKPWKAAFAHEYNALDIDLTSPGPQTNGDLHTLHLAGHWQFPVSDGQLTLSLAPAVAASSNAMKNPDELGSDSLQLWAAAAWRKPSLHGEWILGLAHDYRFGQSRVYPVAGMGWQFSRGEIRATYPDLYLGWEFALRWLLEFSASPDGNEWQAYDRDLEDNGDFRREAWQSNLRLSYRFRKGLRIGLSAGYHWQQAWRMRLQDGSLLRTDSDDSAFFGVHLGWYPP